MCSLGCECMYQKLSNCTPSSNEERHIIGPDVRNVVPTILASRLKQEFPSMTDNQIMYWWRAQSAGYIMRLQRNYVDDIRKLRMDASLHYRTGNTQPVPFPLPPGTVTIQIRGGDKYKEMALVPAEAFVQRYLQKVSNAPFNYARTVYLTSDDFAAIEHCKQALERERHVVMYTHMERMEGGHDIEKVTGFHQNLTHTVVQNLLQLFMSLEADSWIGTRESNWHRLVDELRCVWVNKCSLPYEDIGALPANDYAW